jgi:predicted transposase YbfD/YdcC
VVEGFRRVQEVHFQDVPHSYAHRLDKNHGRVERERYLPNQPVSREHAYFMTSLPNEATHLLLASRAHWGVENGLHWGLDIAFREDDARLRRGYSDQNFAVLRQLALNLLRQDQSLKLGGKGKRLKAGGDEAYLLLLLASAI